MDQACRDCLQQIFQTAAPMLEAMPDALEARNGAIRVAEQPERSVSFQDVLQRHGRTVVGEGAMVQDQTNLNVERGPAAHFAEVEVDKETGKVRILRYVAAHDVGQPLNLTIVENQIEGGSIQGLALALSEQLHFDARTGWCLSANFLDLKPPTALDVDPRVVEAVVVQNKGRGQALRCQGHGGEPLPSGDGSGRQCHFQCDRAAPAGAALQPSVYPGGLEPNCLILAGQEEPWTTSATAGRRP